MWLFDADNDDDNNDKDGIGLFISEIFYIKKNDKIESQSTLTNKKKRELTKFDLRIYIYLDFRQNLT